MTLLTEIRIGATTPAMRSRARGATTTGQTVDKVVA